MRAIPYSEIMERVCDHLGWDPDNLDARQFSSIRRAVSASLGDIWNRFWWADLVRCEERTFRPPYSSATAYSAGDFVWLAGPRAYYQALQSTTGNAPATLSGSTWTLNAQYWAEATTAPSAAEYSSTTAYAVGDQVTYLEDNRVYQCIVAGTGNAPGGSNWGRIEPFDGYVDLLEPGFIPLGRVRAVYDSNPRINAGAARLEWANSQRGVEVYTSLATVWVEGLLRPHKFTGSAYDATASYEAIALADYSGDTEVEDTAVPYDISTRLRDWVSGESYQLVSAVYDSDQVIVSANVRWPDGDTGVFTRLTKNSTFLTVDSYSITHVTSGKTITQPAVTRDTSGNVTAQPALVVS